MNYVLTITERTPTSDGTDINTYHLPVEDLYEAGNRVRDFELNFGVLVSMTIAPVKTK